MDKLDKELGLIFKSEIVTPNDFENTIKNALNSENIKTNKKQKTYNLIKLAATFVITCICGIGVVFASVSTYNYFAKSSFQLVNVVPGSDPEIDKEYGIKKSDEGEYIYYKKISTYDDYVKCKQLWTDLYEMTENDFDEYFIVMISICKGSKLPYYVSDVRSDETTLYIELSQTEDETLYDNRKTFFSIKVEKQHERENIKIKETLVVPNVDTTKYTDIKKIAQGESYPLEQALKEGCFVTNGYNEIVSSDINQVKDFVKSTQEGKEGHIRIVQYSTTMNTVRDLEYRNGKYYLALYVQKQMLNSVETSLTYNRFDRLTEHYVTMDKVNWYHEIWGEDDKTPGFLETIGVYK